MRNKSRENRKKKSTGKSVTVIGPGGNIGSHLVAHLARMPEVEHVTLIDCDTYETKNIRSQDIAPADVGKPKVLVQGRRLSHINPATRIVAIVDRVQDRGLGDLRGDVILCCLDSRESRRWVNEAAWRLAVPMIDAGVEPGGLLVRIEVFVPATGNSPCLECGWDDQDYALLEQTFTQLGARVRFVDITDLDQVAQAVDDEQPVALVCEIISNPLMKVADVPALAEIVRAGL